MTYLIWFDNNKYDLFEYSKFEVINTYDPQKSDTRYRLRKIA